MTELKDNAIRVKNLIEVLKRHDPEDLVGFSYPNYNGYEGKVDRLDLATSISNDWLEFDGKEKTIIVFKGD